MAENSITRPCADAQPKTIITPQFRLVDPINLNGPYLITALFSDDADLTPLRELLHSAAVKKWGADRAAWPAQLRELDFMHAADCDGWPITEDDAGGFSVAMRANKDFFPCLVDQYTRPIYDRESIVAGCTACAEVGVWAFEKDGLPGLGVNLLKLQVLTWQDMEAAA